MAHFLYILHSESTSKYYVGETHNSDERILKHNEHLYSNSFTKIANDWEVVLCFECMHRTQALFLEKFIKRMKSKIFIKKIVATPQILAEILSNK